MIAFSFTANAEHVYESTDDEGVVEFSDKPSSDDAQVIDVEEPKRYLSTILKKTYSTINIKLN